MIYLQLFIWAIIFKNIHIDKMYQRFEESFVNHSQEVGIGACRYHGANSFPILKYYLFSMHHIEAKSRGPENTKTENIRFSSQKPVGHRRRKEQSSHQS
jgi:hypothetical protein